MAKKFFSKRTLAVLMALVMMINMVSFGASAKERDKIPSDSDNMTLYWCYAQVSSSNDYKVDRGLATVTYNGAAWDFGKAQTLTGSAAIVVSPVAGYRIVQIDMLCTGGSDNENPYSCNTYNEGASYTVSSVAGSMNVEVSNFTASTACNHSSNSHKYYIMVTVEAVDEEQTYTVTYTPGTGIGTSYTDGGYSFGDGHTVLAETDDSLGFYKPGYSFAGWLVTSCDDSSPLYDLTGKTFSAGDEFAMPAGNVTLTAQWIVDPTFDYSVIYNANFGENETKADAESISGIYAASHNVSVDANTFVRANYTFIGWNTEADGSGTSYSVNEVITLTAENNTEELFAQWIENEKFDYSVIYNANFGENEIKADAENVSGTYAISHNVSVDANPFVRANYTFIGWNTEADGSGTSYSVNEVIALTAENNTEELFAQWIENEKFDYSVIYNANFGENETEADAENVTGTYAAAYTIGVDANPFIRPNHTFLGWAATPNGEVVCNPGDSISFVEGGSEILYAVWEEHPKYDYTVVYNGNGGALVNGGLSYGDSENVTATYSKTHGVVVDANTFVRANYTFVGWNTEADGSGMTLSAEDVIRLTAENNTATLYAQWIEDPRYDYSVTYNANFGQPTEIRADLQNVTGIYATAYDIDVDANGFVRRGYTFIGWNTEADGSGTAYAAEDVIALTAEHNTEVLYAQWQINSYEYTVVYMVRVNGNAYTQFAGTLPENAPTGGSAAYGTVIDKVYLDAQGLPASLTDAAYTYTYNAIDSIIVAEEGNVVTVYFTCIVEEIPEEDVPQGTVEIPEEDVPLADLPKTGDPILTVIGMAVLSGTGLGLMLGKKRKLDGEETEN